jgi:hypothetical protein
MQNYENCAKENGVKVLWKKNAFQWVKICLIKEKKS